MAAVRKSAFINNPLGFVAVASVGRGPSEIQGSAKFTLPGGAGPPRQRLKRKKTATDTKFNKNVQFKEGLMVFVVVLGRVWFFLRRGGGPGSF